MNKFKAISETFGNAEGDLSLRNFASALKLTFRSTEIIGRLGGDEFAALLLDSNPSDTHAEIKRLRVIVASQNKREWHGCDLCFSVG